MTTPIRGPVGPAIPPAPPVRRPRPLTPELPATVAQALFDTPETTGASAGRDALAALNQESAVRGAERLLALWSPGTPGDGRGARALLALRPPAIRLSDPIGRLVDTRA